MCKRSFLVFCSLMVLGLAGSAMAQSDPSLVGWWTFDDGAGTIAADSSGKGPDIPLVNTTWETGIVGGAVHFHGAGYGTDTAFSLPTNAVTVCTWVWHDAFATNQVERYVTIGPEAAVIRKNSDARLHFYITTGGVFSHIYVGDVLTEGQWHHVAGTWDGVTQRLYLDGVEIATRTPSGALTAGSMIRLSSPDGEPLNGMLDDVRIYNRALSPREIMSLMDPASSAKARDPVPADKATDVPRDVALGWTPGEFAATHDVYFGTTYADVNDAGTADPRGVLAGAGQTDATFAPDGPLDYGQTYYWRIDEVNAAPDNTIFKGKTWSFTVEPYAYPLTNVTATASGSQSGMEPQKAVNGSGLNDLDQHSTTSTDMWMSAGGMPAWIQFEFDRVYKLDHLLVWNSNQVIEGFMGFGAKDVTIEYSEDGETWAALEGVPQFAQATATPAYTANTTVDFGGVMARFVKLTIAATWGGLAPQTGLAEVRFFYAPVQAFNPQPADAATAVSVATDLKWRPGRDATSHVVYIGADADAVADRTASSETVTDHSFAPADLLLGTQYFWKVDEVADAGTYPGAVWSFTTEDYVVVEDFESYNDDVETETTIWHAWIDGLTDGNSGSQVGYDVAPFAERTIVHGGKQAMPLKYNNSSFAFSEATRTFDAPQDWTARGIKGLALYFYGAADNSGRLYVKINNTKIAYDGPAINIVRPSWQLWSIDLAAAGNVSSVKSLTIGIEGSGASGIVYIDDIGLYPEVLDATSPDVTGAGDTVQGVPDDGDWPAAEYPALALDDNVNTKYLHRKGGAVATGFRVAPLAGSTLVTGLTFTTANDDYGRDPISFELSGSNAGIDGPYTLIAGGDIVDFAQATVWPRFTKNATPIEFENAVPYKFYQIVFPKLRPNNDGLMQIAEVEFLGTVVP